MKKFIFSLVFVMVSIMSFGQDLTKLTYSDDVKDAIENWTYSVVKGDELIGTEDSKMYTYITEDLKYLINFKTFSNQRLELIITSMDGIFDYNHYGIVFGNCGLYDANGNLIEALWGVAQKENSNIFVYSKWEEGNRLIVQDNLYGKKNEAKRQAIIDKLFNYLMNETGYVRFVAPKYHGVNMDIKIQCLNNK